MYVAFQSLMEIGSIVVFRGIDVLIFDCPSTTLNHSIVSDSLLPSMLISTLAAFGILFEPFQLHSQSLHLFIDFRRFRFDEDRYFLRLINSQPRSQKRGSVSLPKGGSVRCWRSAGDLHEVDTHKLSRRETRS